MRIHVYTSVCGWCFSFYYYYCCFCIGPGGRACVVKDIRDHFFFFFFFFKTQTSLPLAGNSGRSPDLGKEQQPQEQRYPFLSVCAVFSCIQIFVWLGFLTCAQMIMLMHAIAHGGCTETVRESALEVDSGRKIPCCTGDSNPREYCARAFQSDALPTELFPRPSSY